jgi:hypothetical protein
MIFKCFHFGNKNIVNRLSGNKKSFFAGLQFLRYGIDMKKFIFKLKLIAQKF